MAASTFCKTFYYGDWVMKLCSITDCDKKHRSKGYCAKHYTRYQRHGSPYVIKKTGYGDPTQTDEERFWSKVAITANPDKCWFWQAGILDSGYGQFKYKGKNRRAHQLSFYFTNGYYAKPCVLHSCDNPSCVNPKHLREGTNADNSRDMIARNRNSKGERHYYAKLNKKQVIEIFYSRLKPKALVRKYKIGASTISAIKRKTAWKHITQNL